MPLGSGLGSSAASAAAALVATNELLGNPLQKKELVQFAMEAERIACGAAHADNVAPAIMGGFVLIRSYNPLDIVAIPAPASLYCSIVHPPYRAAHRRCAQGIEAGYIAKRCNQPMGQPSGFDSRPYAQRL